MKTAIRAAAAAVGTAALVLVPAGAASAATLNISPHSQTIKSGGTAHWSLSWFVVSGDHYDVDFYYDDGTHHTLTDTTRTSTTLSHGYVSCNGQTYQVELKVYDYRYGTTSKTYGYVAVQKGAC